MAIDGACHCGAISFSAAEQPEWLTRCNCSICRRTNGLWAHYHADAVTLRYDPARVVRYVWGDKTLALISCATCGCTTHWEGLESRERMGVNVSMAEPEAIAGLRVRNFDGADTWTFRD